MNILIVLALLLGVCAESAVAAGLNSAIKDTVVAKFTAPDLELMMAKVDQALKADKDGEPLDWKNDKTGAGGNVTPLARFSASGLACRRVRIVNTYRDKTGTGVYKFCEEPAGKWKLVGPDKEPG